MSKDEEREIRSVFEKLRQEEERAVPEFYRVLQGKDIGIRSASWDFWRRPAAALLLLVLVMGPILYFSLRETAIPETENASELEDWESPTDFLLSFNDPAMDSSLMEIGTTLWEEDEPADLEN
jgi:hypothetical protein